MFAMHGIEMLFVLTCVHSHDIQSTRVVGWCALTYRVNLTPSIYLNGAIANLPIDGPNITLP